MSSDKGRSTVGGDGTGVAPLTTQPAQEADSPRAKIVECAVLQDAPRSTRDSGRADSMVPGYLYTGNNLSAR